MSTPSARRVSPALVGLCAWLVPGGGYLLLGLRKRGLTILVTIVLLFLMGILVGGIRIMDPPGWGQYGYMSQIVVHGTDRAVYMSRLEPTSAEETTRPRNGDRIIGSALVSGPVAELGAKPWFVGQILCGPITLLASAAAVHEAHPVSPPDDGNAVYAKPQEGIPPSHSRSWEIGALYTAVAGMLNLLAIIDSTFRAGQPPRDE